MRSRLTLVSFCSDEIFGPAISVRTFKTEEEAIELANDTTYGLGCKQMDSISRYRETNSQTATIYTADIARALRVASRLEAGTVGINSAFSKSEPMADTSTIFSDPDSDTSPQTPFGGFKESGIGRESGVEGLRQYLQPKTIHINLSA